MPPKPTIAKIKDRMTQGGIPGVSIAYLDPNKEVPIEPVVIGKTDKHSTEPNVDVEENTVFGAASLSKPVFSYLVLKLIADEQLSTTDGKPFDLDTPISEILSIEDFYKDNLDKKVSLAFAAEASKITPRMVLSHTAGLTINGVPRLDFEPGTEYSYANIGLSYLQKAIEKKTRKSLETLAQDEVFTSLGMSNSSFLPPTKEEETPKRENAANSLHTTATDYARFAQAWLDEKDCALIKMSDVPTPKNQENAASSRYILTETGFFYYNKRKNTVQAIELDETQLSNLQQKFATVTEAKPIDKLSSQDLAEITTITGHTNPLQEALRPAISLTKDQWAIDMGVPEEDRQHLAWGLGLGLQLDDNGEVVTAFHTGDMNQWRGWVAMDVNAKTAVVYFANGNDTLNGSGHGYGHILADVIVAPEVKLDHTLNWFFPKFGVSRNVEPGWKEQEEEDTAAIARYVNKHLSIPQVLTDPEMDKAKLIAVEHGLKPAVVEGEPAGMALLDRMAHYHVPDVSVAIIDGETITPVTYHLASSTEAATTPETLFQAGSISKVVNAIIALKLVEDGKLDLDQDVNERLIGWKVPYDPEFNKGCGCGLLKMSADPQTMAHDELSSLLNHHEAYIQHNNQIFYFDPNEKQLIAVLDNDDEKLKSIFSGMKQDQFREASHQELVDITKITGRTHDTGKVTLRQLLSHTAGLNMWGFPGYDSTTTDSNLPTNEAILKGGAHLIQFDQFPNPKEIHEQRLGHHYIFVEDEGESKLFYVDVEEQPHEIPVKFPDQLATSIQSLLANQASSPHPKIALSSEQIQSLIDTGKCVPTRSGVATTPGIKPIRPPGSTHIYSGGGTQIVQQLIMEAVGGEKPYAEIAKEMVFDPLGMTSSTFAIKRPGEVQASPIANGHMEDGSVVPGNWHLHPESAAAGLWTTPTDLAKLVIGVQNSHILSEETTAAMLTPLPNTPYGLGPRLNPSANEFSHNGGTAGFAASCFGFTQGIRKGAIVMTNSDNGGPLFEELNRSIASVYEWPKEFSDNTIELTKPDPRILSPLEGDYDHGPAQLTISQKDGHFFITGPFPTLESPRIECELKQGSDNAFYFQNDPDNRDRFSKITLIGNPPDRFELYGQPAKPVVANVAAHDSSSPIETTAIPKAPRAEDSVPAAMPTSWVEQEKLEKPIILKKFWEERVLHPESAQQKAFSINAIKDSFLLALPKPGMTDSEWKDKVDKAWADGSAFASEEAFYDFFEHIDSAKAVGIAEGLIPIAEPSKKAIRVTPDEIDAIKQYTQDKDLTISAVIGSVKTGIEPCCSENYSTGDVFSMHSISKVFTGVLALRLLEEGVISEDDLKTPPIQVAPSTTEALSKHPQILTRLNEVNLHQALTHNAGLGVADADVKEAPFGDYYGNYIDAVEKARRNKTPLPEIHTIEDFIPLIPDQTTAAGPVGGDKKHYSNSGIILAALSMEHLYNEKRDKTLEPEPLSFDDIMKKYVTGPTAANMSCFQASSQGLTVSQNSKAPIASDMVGSPGGGYFSTAEDLGKFAQWMHHKCQEPQFVDLTSQYGQEFCPKPEYKTIEHTGDGADSSGFFSLNWETGNLVIVLNDQRAIAASEVGREIQDHIFSQPQQLTTISDNNPISNDALADDSHAPSKETESEPTQETPLSLKPSTEELIIARQLTKQYKDDIKKGDHTPAEDDADKNPADDDSFTL